MAGSKGCQEFLRDPPGSLGSAVQKGVADRHEVTVHSPRGEGETQRV